MAFVPRTSAGEPSTVAAKPAVHPAARWVRQSSLMGRLSRKKRFEVS